MADISNWVISKLKEHEGLRLKPYVDVTGHLTIGYGRNLTARGITIKEAEYLFLNDVRNAQSELIARIPIYKKLTAVRRGILLNMAYNMGVPTLLSFRKMLAALESHDYVEAAKQMLDSRWAIQVGYRARELAEMMETNQVEDRGTGA